MGDRYEKSLFNPATKAKKIHFEHIVLEYDFAVLEFIAPELELFQGASGEHDTSGAGKSGPKLT